MAGPAPLHLLPRLRVSTRSRLKAAVPPRHEDIVVVNLFQHAAARRRLGLYAAVFFGFITVSTQNVANLVLLILNVGFSFRNYAFLAVFLLNKIKDRKIFAEHITIIRESVRKNLLLQIKKVLKNLK